MTACWSSLSLWGRGSGSTTIPTEIGSYVKNYTIPTRKILKSGGSPGEVRQKSGGSGQTDFLNSVATRSTDDRCHHLKYRSHLARKLRALIFRYSAYPSWGLLELLQCNFRWSWFMVCSGSAKQQDDVADRTTPAMHFKQQTDCNKNNI